MARRFACAAALLALGLAAALGAHTGEKLAAFPAPGKFCSGMTWDGHHLWVADYRADALFKLDPASGEVVGRIPAPGFWPKGLAWDGTSLWNVDSAQRKIFQVDPADGTVLRVVEAPTGNPEGLAWDGSTLWVGDRKARKIMKIDLSDGTAVQTIPAPNRSADGLCFDGRYLWCADRESDELALIDPERGDVLVLCDSPGPYPRGLACDGSFLWNLDYQTDEIYKLVRRDEVPYVLKDTRRATVTLTHEVVAHGAGSMQSLDVFLAVPRDMPQQKVLSVEFTPGGHSDERDRWGQPIAVFHRAEIPAGTRVETQMKVQAEISAIRYFIFPDRCGTLADIPPEIRERYTAEGSKYLKSDPYMRALSAQLVGDETNPYYIARRIFDHVRESLEYKLEGGWNVAPVVLKRGTGSCSEYSFCFIALCRAAGLPARYVGALVVRGDDSSFDDVFHRWPEVYLPGYGWVPVDPQAGDKPTPRERAMAIGHLSNRFLITTQGGGDSEYLGWYYNQHERYRTDPQLKVEVEAFAEWDPLDER